MNNPKILFVLGILATLVACGGGSSGGVPTTSNLPQFYQDNYATQATYYTNYTTGGACGFGIPGDSNITAINSSTYDNISLCGAYIEVTGDKGTATVKVVEVCPSCLSQLDLSDVAFGAVTTAVGIANVNWNFVQAPVGTNNIKLHWSSANTWYMAVIVDDHRHPVTTVEVQDSTPAFITLTRDASNQFTGVPNGGQTFPNPTVFRITDRFGNQVEENVTWSASGTTATTMQFPEYQ